MPSQPFTATTEKGQRVALALSYEGSGFVGWQRQRAGIGPTVQQALEEALSRVAAAPVAVQCAGRTDSGVHASYQVVHFDSPADRLEKAWVLGGNMYLPPRVRVHWARPVADNFNARHSATARRYRYLILNQPVGSAHLPGGLTRIGRPLDAARMHAAAQALPGERDFSAFRAASCQSRTPMRNVHRVSVERYGPLVVVDISANAFLHHMVRNIVGSLLDIGSGEQPVEWLAGLLGGRDRRCAGPTAPPDGLYLVDVSYPTRYGLPPGGDGPDFLAPLWRD